MAQAGNAEKLKSFLDNNSFTKEELTKALLYARQELRFDCYAHMKSCGSHETCATILGEKIIEQNR